ncbi:MAG: ferritin family protein [Sedimentisphaerales bacterium]|jgi:rubrerythrin|nr:ferritin family protein [Sedimentisphaerales bacterium]
MGLTFSADEIFEMAEGIERNGMKFYTEAAKVAPDKKSGQMLLNFAEMEAGHLRIFEDMRKGLAGMEKEAPIFDPEGQAALYLAAIADSSGWEGKANPAERLTGKESIEDIFKTAIEAEKDSVVFYIGLQELVPVRAGKDKIEAIIKEEMSHISSLSGALAEYKS